MKGAALACWAVGIAVAALALDATGPTAEAGRHLLYAAGAVLFWLIAAVGSGGALLYKLSPALLNSERGWLHATVAGLGLWGLGGLLVAGSGHASLVGFVGLGLGLACGWALRPRVRPPTLRAEDLGLWASAGLIVVLPGLLRALAPATDTDELYYHLALPREMLTEGGLIGGLLRPDGNRPMILHLSYAAVMSLGSDSAPRLLHLILSCGVLAATASLGREIFGEKAGFWAAMLLTGSWSFASEAGLASNNLPTALAVLAACDAARRGQGAALAVAAGVALSIKYTAGGAIAGIYLIAALSWRARVGWGLAALAVVAPWWARNALMGLHPLFPFAGWPTLGLVDFAFQFPEKYGAGRDLGAILLLPWNAVITARIDSFRFLGHLSPLWLALVPAAALAWRNPDLRRLALASLVIGIFWAMGPQWLRYLLPGLPILALALSAGAEQVPALARVAFGLVWLVGLPANGGSLLQTAADRLDVATGHETSDDFLARNLEDWPVYQWCNEHLPPDAGVALLFNYGAALLDRPVLMASVEDHVPTRYFLLTHKERSLDALAEAGAGWVVVTRVHFAHRLYPFLSEASFNASFAAPEALLDALLLSRATLVYEHRRTAVYRLPER